MLSGLVFGLQHRLLLWRRRGWDVAGDRTWKHMRRFCGWMCGGCIAGVIAFTAILQSVYFSNASNVPGIAVRNNYELKASADRYMASFSIFYPWMTLCTIYSMNMLLRRVSDHASHSYYNQARDHGRITGHTRFDLRDFFGQYALYYFVRSMNVISVLLCVSNILARIVSAAFRAEAAGILDQAAAACGAGGTGTNTSQSLYNQYLEGAAANSSRAAAASRVVEAVLHVGMVAGFLLFFPPCIIMFYRVERRLNGIIQEMNHRTAHGNVFLPYEFSPTAADGTQTQTEMRINDARSFLGLIKSSAVSQRRRFYLCLIIVLAALVCQALLAVVITLIATGNQSVPNSDCELCQSCQSISYLITQWYIGTPEFLPLVTSITSTLPLMLSLWLMTTKEDRELMINPSRFRADSVSHQPDGIESLDVRLKTERMRMGVELR